MFGEIAVMRQHLLMALAGLVVVGMAGCGTEETPPPIASSPAPVVSPAPQAGTQTFTQPLVTQNPNARPPVPPALPGLIQSTNPDERARQVQATMQAEKATNNPFAPVPITAPKLILSPSATVPTVAQLPKAPTQAQPQTTPATPTGQSTPNRPQTAGRSPSRPPAPSSPFPTVARNPRPTSQPTSALPSGSKPGPSIAALPPRPSTTLAEGVEVTGVIQVNGKSQAIVKAPNEPTSRYVQAGQRLSNGQVLVKRIEMNPGGTPIVVLEQNGIEISRGVGDSPQLNSQQSV